MYLHSQISECLLQTCLHSNTSSVQLVTHVERTTRHGFMFRTRMLSEGILGVNARFLAAILVVLHFLLWSMQDCGKEKSFFINSCWTQAHLTEKHCCIYCYNMQQLNTVISSCYEKRSKVKKKKALLTGYC